MIAGSAFPGTAAAPGERYPLEPAYRHRPVLRLAVGDSERNHRWAHPLGLQGVRPGHGRTRVRRELGDGSGQQRPAARRTASRLHGRGRHELDDNHGLADLRHHHHIVVVKTDTGYDAKVGHPGTGTVVATVC